MPNPNDQEYIENPNFNFWTAGYEPDTIPNPNYKQSLNPFETFVKNSGIELNEDTQDFLMQWYGANKEQNSAWQKTLQYDNTKYQRAVADMKAAGLNPFLLLSNSPSSPNLSSASVSGGSYSARRNAQTQAGAQIAGSAMGLLGALIMGCLMAFA